MIPLNGKQKWKHKWVETVNSKQISCQFSLFALFFKYLAMYDFMIELLLCLFWAHSHLLCLMCVHILTVFCALCFFGWTLGRIICLWCTGQTAEYDTEHIFDEWMCWFMLQIGSVMGRVDVCVCLLKWKYLFWWKMQKVSWINNGKNFWCLSSWPN